MMNSRTSNSIIITWTAANVDVGEVARHIIKVRKLINDKIVNEDLQISDGHSLTYKIKELEMSTDYSISIKAVYKKGDETGFSIPIEAETKFICACNTIGTIDNSSECVDEQCDCDDTKYKGKLCTDCVDGFYNENNECKGNYSNYMATYSLKTFRLFYNHIYISIDHTHCLSTFVECGCNDKGTKNNMVTCSPTGACTCDLDAGYKGEKCNECKSEFFANSATNTCASMIFIVNFRIYNSRYLTNIDA